MAAGITSPTALAAQDHDPRVTTFRNTFGEIGVLDMPTGHTAPDGELAFTVGGLGNSQRYTLSFQALPWLEATFRYSHVVGLFEGYNRTHFYDRSFAVKLRLLDEGTMVPDVSVGLRDILGTGIYSSEYLAASKHFGPLDLTVGLGWGKLGETDFAPNPLGLFSSSFKTRPAVDFGLGGTPRFSSFFRGPIGVFGGLIWETPVPGLGVLAEYSSSRYDGYVYEGGIRVRSPLNVGLSYRAYEALSLSAGWYYGTTYGFTVSLRGDPKRSYPSGMRIGPSVPAPAIRTDVQQQVAISVLHESKKAGRGGSEGRWVDVASPAERTRQAMREQLLSAGRGVRDVDLRGEALVIDAHALPDRAAQCAGYARIASAASTPPATIALTDLQEPSGAVIFCAVGVVDQPSGEALQDRPDEQALRRKIVAGMLGQSLQLDFVSVGPSEIWLYYENYKYNSEAEAIGRIVRLLMAEAPASVELFHIVAVKIGTPMQKVTVARSAMERSIVNGISSADLGNALSIGPPPLRTPPFDGGSSGLYPLFTWSLDPKLTQHVFDPDAPLQFMLYADATGLLQLAPGLMLASEITGTLWTDYRFERAANSELPHVRTDLLQYLKHGKYGISSLQLIYREPLTPTVMAELRAGYLEDMYMGGGVQVLWRPERSRFAFGADLYQVWKRDFNRLFGHQDYQVLTGHVSAYYASPWYGLNFAVRAGRYLAGDYGGTFEITRRFASGVEVGAWATFTNVPFHRFGEGSFDKGIIIRIPFEWGLPIFSQSAYDLRMSSLTRDGGQRVSGDDALYGISRMASYGDITEHLGDVVDP